MCTVRISIQLIKTISPSKYNKRQREIFEELPETFESHTMYKLCKFLLYHESDNPTLREEAFVSGTKAAEDIHTDTQLYYEVVSLGIELVRQTILSDREYYGEQMNKDTVLSKSAKLAERTISSAPNIPGHYLVYGSVLELQEEFERALEVLRQGRSQCIEGDSPMKNPQGGHTSAAQEVPKFNDKIDTIQKEQQRNELEQSIKDADDKLRAIDSDLSRIEAELEETVEQYRTQIFQFIGFFAAILTIALTSVQIATQLSFPQSGGLVLVLIGGITLAFGELNALFDTASEQSGLNIRPILIGGALIIVGLYVGVYF